MNQQIGSDTRKVIRTAMTGLAGPMAKAMALKLSADHNISWQYVYEMTADLRDKKRKTRSDAGRRTFKLEPGTDVWYAAQLVVVDKLDPDQALLTAKTRGRDKLPTLTTFQTLLRENGLGKKQRNTGRRAHRRFEAEHPGERYQIDCTALKIRWQDVKTRRALTIAGVDKNHPQADPGKLRVWQILGLDDHSRYLFLRYVTAPAITSFDMVRFECEMFQRLGVPRILYTDNGSEFKGHHVRAERILNTLLKDEDGYVHERHAPNNPQATGKVEAAHKAMEKADRYVGLAITEGQAIDLEKLNAFADAYCHWWNNRVHRSTNEKPVNRWHGKRIVVRKLSPDVVESALLSDEFEVKLNPDMTVTHRTISYKVPNCVPFVDYVGKTVRVVVPQTIGIILLTLPNAAGKFEPTNGGEFEIEKILATVDKAGEYKTVAESKAIRMTRDLKEDRKQEVAAIKEQKRLTGEVAPVPHINVEVPLPADNTINFPQPQFVVSAEEVNKVVPVPMTAQTGPQAGAPGRRVLPAGATAPSPASSAPASVSYVGKPISYWQAVAEYQSRFQGSTREEQVQNCKSFLETDLYPGQQGDRPVTQVEAAIANYLDPQQEAIRKAS